MPVKACAICNNPIHFTVHTQTVECAQCGSTYDVIHASISPEVSITGQKKPTEIQIYLWNEAETERMEDKTVYVGTKILVRSALFTEPWYTGLDGKRHIIWHRLDEFPAEKILDEVATYNFAEVLYTITKAGRHYFWAEFPGDDEYEGCPSTIIHCKTVDYGVSDEASVTASPALTVRVSDKITKAKIGDAKVTVNGYEATTVKVTKQMGDVDGDGVIGAVDLELMRRAYGSEPGDPNWNPNCDLNGDGKINIADFNILISNYGLVSGEVVFEVIPPGSYAIRVTAPGYIDASKRIMLTEAGAVVEMELIPIWVIPAGVAATGGLILIGTKIVGWW